MAVHERLRGGIDPHRAEAERPREIELAEDELHREPVVGGCHHVDGVRRVGEFRVADGRADVCRGSCMAQRLANRPWGRKNRTKAIKR